MASWLLAYGNRFLKTEKIIYDMLITRKDTRIWMGFESILALAYMRFRPGGKFRFKKGFKIGTDHLHEFKVGDYTFNVQSMKRCMFGGNSMDLLNFKTPLFYIDNVLAYVKPENKKILIRIARESVQSLLSTYNKDILATDTLRACDLILETIDGDDDGKVEGENLAGIKKYLSIPDAYMENPLTKKNYELWIEHIDILNRICILYGDAYNDLNNGRNPDNNLNEIKVLQETVREKLENFLMEIPHGNS